MSEDLKHLGTIHGKPGKPYRVFRDVAGSEQLGEFDTIEEAQTFIAKKGRRDWKYIVRQHGRKIVWPVAEQ